MMGADRDYIREFEETRKILIERDSNTDTLSLIDTIVEKPKYDSSFMVLIIDSVIHILEMKKDMSVRPESRFVNCLK